MTQCCKSGILKYNPAWVPGFLVMHVNGDRYGSSVGSAEKGCDTAKSAWYPWRLSPSPSEIWEIFSYDSLGIWWLELGRPGPAAEGKAVHSLHCPT